MFCDSTLCTDDFLVVSVEVSDILLFRFNHTPVTCYGGMAVNE